MLLIRIFFTTFVLTSVDEICEIYMIITYQENDFTSEQRIQMLELLKKAIVKKQQTNCFDDDEIMLVMMEAGH